MDVTLTQGHAIHGKNHRNVELREFFRTFEQSEWITQGNEQIALGIFVRGDDDVISGRVPVAREGGEALPVERTPPEGERCAYRDLVAEAGDSRDK